MEAVTADAVQVQTPDEQRILRLLTAYGPLGATDEQMQLALALPPERQRPARCNLVDCGLVDAQGATRRTSRGRRALVWGTVASSDRRA